MYRLGLTSISFRGLTFTEIIQITKDAGLSVIEWGSDVHAPKNDVERLRAIAAADKEAGIECSSYGTYFKLGVDDISDLSEYINAARILGTKILRIWAGKRNYTEMSEQERETMIDEARRAARIAEENGVVLCMECHNNSFTNCKEGALRLMKEVDSPAFRMYWQPNQHEGLEYNLEYARAIREYTYNLHVFYWEGKNMLPLSDGVQCWKKYLEIFDGDRALLFEFMPDNQPKTLIREAETLRKLIQE